MKRLIEKTVLVGLVTAWRLATVPTRRSPDWAKATTDGVVRPPSAFSMTVGSPPSRTAMHEFVVPRSIPMVLAMGGGSPCYVKKISVGTTKILAHERRGRRVAGGRGPRRRRCSSAAGRAGGEPAPRRAEAQQRALLAPRPPRVTRAAAVAQQVDVQLELAAARGERE